MGAALLATSLYADHCKTKLASGCKVGQGLKPFKIKVVSGPAKEKGKSFWWRWFDRLADYCERKFGPDWQKDHGFKVR